jgi:hypothetical protein
MSRVAQFFRPAQAFPILAGRRAKQPPILAAGLRGAVIPHGKADGRDIVRRQQGPGAGFLQAFRRDNAGSVDTKRTAMAVPGQKDYVVIDALCAVAGEVGATPAAVALAWVRSRLD